MARVTYRESRCAVMSDGTYWDIIEVDRPILDLPNRAYDLADCNDIPRGTEYCVPEGWSPCSRPRWSDFHPTASLPKREDYDSDLEFERWKWQDR